MKTVRAIVVNTKESWAACAPLLRDRKTSKKEKTEALLLGVFGGILWTWITKGLQKEEKNGSKRSH